MSSRHRTVRAFIPLSTRQDSHVVGQWCFEFERRPCDRMRQRHPPGMKSLARELRVGDAVNLIAEDRATESG